MFVCRHVHATPLLDSVLCVNAQAAEAGAGKGSAANETEPEKVEYEEVTKTHKKTLRLPLKLSGPGFAMPKMTPEQIKVRNTAATKLLRIFFAIFFCRGDLRRVVDNCGTWRTSLRNLSHESVT